MSGDELLGRARRAVLAVAGTAGTLGGRVRRGRDNARSPSGQGVARPRPAPTPGLPPRIGREPQAGLPPRIERAAAEAPAQPPRIERAPEPELPPRIRRPPTAGLPPRIEHAREPEPGAAPPARPEVAPTRPETPYKPKHARIEPPEPAPAPAPAEAEPEPEDGGDVAPAARDDAAPVAAAATPPSDPSPPRPAPAAAWRPPSRSDTVRGALRPHARFVGVIVAVLLVLGAGYYVLRVHQRISGSSLEGQIQSRDAARAVRCSALKSNGSTWACAVVFNAEAECLIARVNVVGSWSTAVRPHRCAKISDLVAILPQRITPAAVAADVGRQLGVRGLTCRKVPQHEVRWACGLPPAPGGQCLVVRAVSWQMWPAQDGGRLCDHFPALETAIRAAQGAA